jgi:hypothetical protein
MNNVVNMFHFETKDISQFHLRFFQHEDTGYICCAKKKPSERWFEFTSAIFNEYQKHFLNI